VGGALREPIPQVPADGIHRGEPASPSPERTAKVSFFRGTEPIGSLCVHRILVDGQAVFSLRSGERQTLYLAPGRYWFGLEKAGDGLGFMCPALFFRTESILMDGAEETYVVTSGVLLRTEAKLGKKLPAPTVETGAVEFQEMQFALPAGQWQRFPGSPPTTQVLFMLKQGDRRAQSFSVWRVSYQKTMYGLTPKEHTKRYWDYEQFGKPRPTPWAGFARSTRTIAGKEYPIMTYQWRDPEVMADGIFLAYFPDDFQKRECFYILQWEDIHPPAVKRQGWEWFDLVVASFTVGPIPNR